MSSSSETLPTPIIKKRTRPTPRVREISIEREEDTAPENEEEANLPLADLLELRKLRKTRGGIDVAKLNKGDLKKKKKRLREEGDQGGLKKGAGAGHEEEERVLHFADEEGKEAKTRRAIRTSNFTQQTNALDVDKHMLAYIEENLKVRSRPRDNSDDEEKLPLDPQEALYRIEDRWKVEKQKPTTDVGSVTNSMTMLTAIPEVDLGMDTRLKNIEETEKAKRVVAEERQERKKTNADEEHLVASRFYRPNLRAKSDADILRDAKLEAMGMPPQDDSPRRSNHERVHMATDEMVMERFKKRMRK
ncbi:hepatocellular carcinoma-associated antigen 59-domain-containing protein [Gymnopilus junonius]|uniref:Hepatocellular carcinoma-associated antigen 59-domain-containing protein n=1 Tax=Gymnopilus junonius TaxID=109634 RepID=A0A9P5P205_GYMJU|nr:hepatocellular carcinoma-associated antigen 59-domain-containing protein [Gymnopilus junonius]